MAEEDGGGYQKKLAQEEEEGGLHRFRFLKVKISVWSLSRVRLG